MKYADKRLEELNKSQRKFIELHAFHDPHRWKWVGVDWEATERLTGKMVANSHDKQATISTKDLHEIRWVWKDGQFPIVSDDVRKALKND